MSVKNAMNAVDKKGKLFIVCEGVGYYFMDLKLVTFNVPENYKKGLYDKRLFTELGEFELVHDLDEKYTVEKKQIDEFVNDEFVQWEIEKNKLTFFLSAVSEDEIRYFMNGLYFDNENVVSTDGRKLIYTENKNVNRNCIASCYGCKKLWTQAKEIYIGLKCTKLVFSDCELYVGHIDGQFPPYNKVIPEFSDNYTVAIPAKKELEYFLKRAKVTNAKDPEVRYQLTNKKNEEEFVFFDVKCLLDIEKFGITELYGQQDRKTFTVKHEGMSLVIMPMVR